jgi:WD40 repeat protein
MSSDEFRYWAFVSYSHKDRKWGEWLVRTLETFTVPKDLVGSEGAFGEIPGRIFPLFRDRDELPVAADLSEKITDALAHSRFLIVICSPASASSRWVNKEIATFKAMGRGRRVLSLIVDGEPGASSDPARAEEECFPSALRYEVDETGELTAVPADPLAADTRDSGDGKRDASLKIVAAILGVSFDAVKRRDDARRIRRLRVTIASLALLTATIAGLAYYANDRRIVADENALVARARQLASKAQYLETAEPSGLRTGVLLASQSIRLHRTFEADALLRKGIHLLPKPVKHFEHAMLASPLALDANQNYVATGAIDGSARVWDVRRLEELTAVQLRSRLTRVAVSADGKYLVTGDREGVVRIWENSTGNEIHSLRCKGQVTSIVFSSSGRLLAIASERDAVLILKVNDWSNHAIMVDPDGRKAPLALSFGVEERLAAVTSDGGLQVWDTTSGEELKHIPGDFPGSMCCNAVIAYSGRYLTGKLIPNGNLLRIWDTENWELAAAIRHDADIQAISFSWFTDFFATGDTDGNIQVWDPHRWQLVSRMKHSAEIIHLEFDRQRKQLVSASSDKTARVWDVKSGEELVRAVHRGPVAHAGFIQASSQLVTVADDGYLSVWQTLGTDFDWRTVGGHALGICIARGGEEITIAFPGYAYRLKVADRSYSERTPGYLQANAALVSEDCRFAAYVDRNRRGGEVLRVFDLDQAKELWPLDPTGSIADLAFSPDSRFLAVAYDDRRIQVIEMTSGTSIHAWKDDGFRASRIVFARSGELLVSTQGRTIGFRNAADGFKIAQEIELKLVRDLAAQPAGRFVAAATTDGVFLIDTQSFEYKTLSNSDDGKESESKSIDRVAFSADNRWLVTAGRSIRVWDIHSKRPRLTIKGISQVEFLAFSARGDKLIAVEEVHPAPGVKRYLTRVWDTETGEELARINSESQTAAAALSHKDEILVNGGVHPFDIKTLVRDSCARMAWEFDAAEWARLSLGLEQTPSCPEQGDSNRK